MLRDFLTQLVTGGPYELRKAHRFPFFVVEISQPANLRTTFAMVRMRWKRSRCCLADHAPGRGSQFAMAGVADLDQQDHLHVWQRVPTAKNPTIYRELSRKPARKHVSRRMSRHNKPLGVVTVLPRRDRQEAPRPRVAGPTLISSRSIVAAGNGRSDRAPLEGLPRVRWPAWPRCRLSLSASHWRAKRRP